MASPIRPASKSHSVSRVCSNSDTPDPLLGLDKSKCHQPLTALSVEFVAKPEEAERAEHTIAAAMEGSLLELAGYAGCLVMISNQEARLITVITFWSGPHGAQLCRQNAKWMNALLKPYMDRCLRSQTVTAWLTSQMQLGSGSRQATSGYAEKTVEFESDLRTVA